VKISTGIWGGWLHYTPLFYGSRDTDSQVMVNGQGEVRYQAVPDGKGRVRHGAFGFGLVRQSRHGAFGFV
jgi:hypothetical protein